MGMLAIADFVLHSFERPLLQRRSVDLGKRLQRGIGPCRSTLDND